MRPTLLLVVIFSIIVQNTVSEKNETIDSTPLPIDEAENPSPLLPGDLDIGDGTLPSVVCNKSFCSNYFKHLKGRCEPIYENSCCPLAFDCSNEIKPKDKSVCRLNGATYLPDQEVNTGNPCMKCRCLMTPDNETELSCFNIEPPSIFHGPDFLLESEQCLHINVLGQCTKEKICSKEEIDAIKKKAKCPYMGKVYDYGEEFQVDDCTYCVCNDDWTGDTRNTKSCNVLQCNFEMESDNYDSGCEPIYMESGSCCPIESICPDEIKSITRITKDEVCNDELNIGTGNESIPSFYFNKNSNLCEHFFYKGSGGNRNRFTSFGRCMVKCEDGYSTCDLEPVTGVCLAHFTKFFFNKTSGNCEPFLYGGCGGNTNNFRTMEECTAQCKQPKESAMCVYNGQEFNKGEQLLLQTKYDRPCIQVHCIAPPHLTFIHKTCPEPPEDPNCEAIYQRGQCCPSYKCPKKEKKICLSKRFFQLQIANGCTAEYELDDVEEFCPIRFTCPDQPPVHESQCYVNGKVYKVNDTIENGPNCKQCYCTDKKGLGPVVECLGTPCSSHGNLNTNDIQLCYFSFNDTDSCCPNARCERREEIARCTYNDQTFYDGQIIPSDRDPCTICHCNKDWAGIDGPTCVKKDCKLELQRDRFLKQCLPVYLQNSCCPVNWICPSTNKLPVDADLREKCYFNKTGYSQGKDLDYLHRSNCIKCKCIAPPHFTCVEEQCPPPPNPEKGFRCQPQRITGGCCPTYNCTIPIKDPCFKMRCKEGEMCVRVVENCPVKPCHDQPKCVPIDHKPCDDYNCSSAEVCIVHTFPCESKTNCPVRATCLPRDPCEDSKLQCGEGKVCKNLIPSCSLSPCPLVATCVDDDPCKDACKLNQRCIATKDVCKVPPCKMKANCIDLSCPTPACAADSEFRPFGFGKGNCPFCQKIF